jgi:hypothetical protein
MNAHVHIAVVGSGALAVGFAKPKTSWQILNFEIISSMFKK